MTYRQTFRRPAFLLGVLVAVVLGGVLLERLRPPASLDAPALGVDAADVLAIRVQQGSRQLRAVQVEGEWRVEEPLPARANAGAAIAAIVDAVAGVVALDEFSRPDLDRRTIGLDPPRARIDLTVRGRTEPVVLLLGDYTPTGGSVYGAVMTEPRILQIGAAIASEIEKAFYQVLPQGGASG